MHANETRKQYYDLRQKQVIRATGLSKQCTNAYRDSHDASRHKLRQTLAYNTQQFHLPFHLQFVTLDLFSQDSQCDPTAEHHSNICLELHVSPLCTFGESVFALMPDHEVRAAKLTNRWISGCWWGRDASSDEHLVGTKHGVLGCRSVRRKPPGEQWSRRETIGARGTKWNFDVETDSGVSGPPVTSRPDEGVPTATGPMEIPKVPPPATPPPAPPPPEMRVYSNSGGGDVAAKTEMMIFDPSYWDPAKTKVIGKVVRYTKKSRRAFSNAAERGRQIDRYWPNHHYTEVTGTERHQRNDGIVETTCHFRGSLPNNITRVQQARLLASRGCVRFARRPSLH